MHTPLDLPPNMNIDEPFGVILALLPDPPGMQNFCLLNHQISDADLHCEEDPIIFAPIEQATSLPHMTLVHLWIQGLNSLRAITSEMEQIGETGSGVWIALDRMGTWNGDEWLFCFPDPFKLAMNGNWHDLRRAVFDGGKITRHRCQDHELAADETADRRAWHRATGYAYCDLPHVTIASLKPGSKLPQDFPDDLCGILMHFGRLVLGLRGPRGTITKIIHEVPLGS